MARAEAERKRVFQEALYEADERGRLRAVLPSRCAFAEGTGACRMYVHHRRPRQTGPRFPVEVVSCRDHPHGCYTLYPPGHFPYGRKALAPYSPAGVLQLDASTGQPLWEATLFLAAQDAAAGERWPAHSPWDDPRRRRTQGRWLEFGGRLLGVHPEQDEGTRERIAARLGVPLVRLVDQARRWGVDWRTRGAALLTVLLMMGPGSPLARSGGPERLDPGSPRSRGPPSTTLQPPPVTLGM